MEGLIGWVVTIALSATCFATHSYVLSWITQADQKFRMFTVMLLLALLHAAQIHLYGGVTYYLSRILNAAELEQAQPSLNTFQDHIYFSATNYTSLGYGDITADGVLQLIATFEALTGLLAIGWSTAFAFWWMQRHWLKECLEEEKDVADKVDG